MCGDFNMAFRRYYSVSPVKSLILSLPFLSLRAHSFIITRTRGIKLNDYQSQLSVIINFDAINRHQFFHARCNQHEKLALQSGVEFVAPVSGAC